MEDQNKIVGMQVAVAKADFKDGKYVIKNDGEIDELIGKLRQDSLGLEKESMLDCVDQLEKMGSFEELSKKHNAGNGDEHLCAGLVIKSKKDPRLCCSVEFGSKWNKDKDAQNALSPKADVLMKFFLDIHNELNQKQPEHEASFEELDLVNMLRGKDVKKENFTSMKPLIQMEGVDEIVGKNAKAEILTESLCETGEADQDYDKKAYNGICKHIEKAGMQCSHKEFDKYQGVYINVNGITKLWTVDYFVTGKAKTPKGKYKSALLIDDEGNKFSASKGDYFMQKPSYEFLGQVLELITHDGKKKIIKNPKVSDLPDSLDVSSGISFEGEPDDVFVLECAKDESRFEVVLRNNKVIDDDGLVDHLKKMKESLKMESRFNDFEAVDFFGIPKQLTEEVAVQKSHEMVKDSELMVGSVKEKDKELEKMVAEPKGDGEANEAGEAIAKPEAAELHGDSVKTKESELPKDEVKVGDPGDDKGEHVKGDGKSDDQQKEVAAKDVKVGEPGKDHGKHMSEERRLKIMESRKRVLENIRNGVRERIVEARKKAMAKFEEVEKKEEAKALPDSVRTKLREMMKKKHKNA